MLDRIRNCYIDTNEELFWNSDTYLREQKETNHSLINKTYAIPLNPEFYVDQFSSEAFTEFNGTSHIMKSHGCGIVSLHHVLMTLSDEYPSSSTVGSLADFALSFHKNDLRDENGNLLMKGTPVLALNIGWYHNALVHVATKFGLNGHRLEGINLENVTSELNEVANLGNNVLSIISVKDNYKNAPQADGSAHLVVVSGFRYNSIGKLNEVMITDPNAYISNGEHINCWVSANKVKNYFLGKAMFFYISNKLKK